MTVFGHVGKSGHLREESILRIAVEVMINYVYGEEAIVTQFAGLVVDLSELSKVITVKISVRHGHEMMMTWIAFKK